MFGRRDLEAALAAFTLLDDAANSGEAPVTSCLFRGEAEVGPAGGVVAGAS